MYNPQEDLSSRVRGVLGGLDENQLPDTQIQAYEYMGRAIKEISKRMGVNLEDLDEDTQKEVDSAIVYLCGSYFCPVMATIQPQSEKGKQSQYTLQTIDYNLLENKLMNTAYEIIDSINSSESISGYGGLFRVSNPS